MNLTRPHQVSIARLLCSVCLVCVSLSFSALSEARRVALENGDVYEGDIVDGLRHLHFGAAHFLTIGHSTLSDLSWV